MLKIKGMWVLKRVLTSNRPQELCEKRLYLEWGPLPPSFSDASSWCSTTTALSGKIWPSYSTISPSSDWNELFGSTILVQQEAQPHQQKYTHKERTHPNNMADLSQVLWTSSSYFYATQVDLTPRNVHGFQYADAKEGGDILGFENQHLTMISIEAHGNTVVDFFFLTCD